MGSIGIDPKRSQRPPRRCGVCHLLGMMTEGERKELNGYLRDPEIRYSDLAEAMAASGPLAQRYGDAANMDRSQYARHARGACGARANLRPKLNR